MKILILDGTFGDRHTGFRRDLVEKMAPHPVEVIKLEDVPIVYCTGCWTCWVKTPGICVHKDFTPDLCRAVINADLVIHFTENSAGFATSLTKKATEKLIPLIHPYIELVDGECHHQKRYETYPEFGLVFIDEEPDGEDFETTKRIYQRFALNAKSKLSLSLRVKVTEGGYACEPFSL